MKKILVIGATSAMAKHCARIWALRGDELFLVARDPDHLEAVARDLKVRGAQKVATFCLDLNRIQRHPEFIEQAKQALGSIDIALIAHGTLSDQAACEVSVETTLEEIRTNALSVISLMTLLANEFEPTRKGSIAVISSVAGDRGRKSNYVYGSAKAMVTAFASGLRHRLHKAGVNVLTIKPGFVDTPMTASFQKGPLWAKPETVAALIVKAIDKKKDEIYVPGFWRYIMWVIRMVPTVLFKKTNI